MSEMYQKFNPGEYLEWEREAVDFRMSVYRGEVKPGAPFGDGEDDDWTWFQKPHRYTEEEILAYNKLWNPRDPLYCDPAYAKAHGHRGVQCCQLKKSREQRQWQCT